ncbi:MAG TPA: hypothetical protein VGV38_02735, partial [Pyrinomonadaceae bacterium]|nr:hypothetical protein [Pyrinomonadaceae bacterium]
MAKRGASYTLSVLLKLNDQLSGRLNKSVAALRRFDKQSRTSLAGYDLLRKSLNKPVSVAGLGKLDTRLKAVSRSLRAVARDKNKLGVAMGRKPARESFAATGVEREPARRRTPYDSHVREYRARERERADEAS